MKQKIADLINVVFGMRKFIAWFALFIIAIAFRIMNYIDGLQFVDLMKSTFAGFVAGNGVEHLMTTVKSYIDNKSVSQAPSVPQGENLVDSSPDSNEDKETPADGK